MKLIWNDYLIAATLLLMVSVQMITNFVAVYYQNVADTVAIAKEVFYIKEANPLQFWLMTIAVKVRYMIYAIFEPALMLAFYILLRMKKIGFNSPLAFDMFTLLVFLTFLMNFLNDLPQLAAYMLK